MAGRTEAVTKVTRPRKYLKGRRLSGRVCSRLNSNSSYGILGEVVEPASRRLCRELMREELLSRLGMLSSGFNLRGHDVAVGYRIKHRRRFNVHIRPWGGTES